MTFFADLVPYTYLLNKEEPGAVCVGWLGAEHPFEKGETTSDFRVALSELCNNKSINHCMGHHVCEFCPDATFGDEYFLKMGNGEIRVRSMSGAWYVAPTLIIHYVEAHDYLPPQEFIEAVVNPSEIGKETEQFLGQW